MTSRTMPALERQTNHISGTVTHLRQSFEKELEKGATGLTQYKSEKNLLVFVDEYLWRKYLNSSSGLPRCFRSIFHPSRSRRRRLHIRFRAR